MRAKARFECKMECRSAGTPVTRLLSIKNKHLENHLTHSSMEPCANSLLPWSFPFSMPCLLASTAMSGYGSSAEVGDALAFVATSSSSSSSLASTISILLNPGAGLEGSAAAFVSTFVGGASSSSSSLSSTISMRRQPPAEASWEGFLASGMFLDVSTSIFAKTFFLKSSASALLLASGNSLSTASTSSNAALVFPSSRRAIALRYFALAFLTFKASAAEQSVSASAQDFNLMWANARFEWRME
mmetsp:Transcript_61647/g.112973  ORF Transcript_61647/g.112973 Transcript_61647/m.112973 type:complete len:244 (-) Transcript_61647:319-1050(-)